MITELKWDSELFGRKIGRLVIKPAQIPYLRPALRAAKSEGFQYITSSIASQDMSAVRTLESSGFYLTDIGVTLSAKATIALGVEGAADSGKDLIKPATREDATAVQRLAKSLFLLGRFYHDPFFSREEADRLYQAWVQNAISGNVADIVLYARDTGFIVCKETGRKTGEISLIGIKKSKRGKGYGTALIKTAMEWFVSRDIECVSVRTQLRNISSLNFYLSLGFSIEGYDLVFGKIL
jgi:GNAT superfamily N-acetyltransferase